MSAQSRRTPAAATSTTPTPRSSRRRKVAEADSEGKSDAPADDGDADSDSSKVNQRSTKRQKRSLSPKKATASRTRGGARKKKRDADEDEDEEMDEKEEGDVNSPYGRHEHDAKLNTLVESKYELLFAQKTKIDVDGQSTASSTVRRLMQQSGLPKILTQHICDFLPITDIASRLAVTSRSGYVTARSYAELVQSQLVQEQNQDPEGNVLLPDSNADSAQKKRLEEDRVGVRRSEFPLLSSSYPLKAFTYRMLQSRLRGLITEVSSQYEIIQDHTQTYKEPLDCVLPFPAEISNALPNLPTAHLKISSMRTAVDYAFPPGLRRLNLTLDLNSKWNNGTMTQYLTRLFNGLGQLKYLNQLTISPSSPSTQDLLQQYLEILFQTLSALPHLRVLHSECHNLLTSNSDMMARLPATLTDIMEIGRDKKKNPWEAFSSAGNHESVVRNVKRKEFVSGIAKSSFPLFFLSLKTFIFDRIMKTEHIPIYTSMAASLTSLEFDQWQTSDVAWLGECTQLRTFSNCGITADPNSRCGVAGALEPVIASLLIPTQPLVDALVKCTHVINLRLNVEKMTTGEFDQLLSSMTSLCHFRIASCEVSSIESLSSHEHLSRNLESLTISLPRVPRDDVVHLYSLKRLTYLNIAGSFTDPLFSNQLAIIKGRSPQLPYIRLSTFVPRSQREPIPLLPIAPEVRSQHLVEFNARVKSGKVSSAELINANQLTLIYQCLDQHDFARSARSCRTWHDAATEPSAWPTPSRCAIFDRDRDRRLKMSTQSPEFVPSILPQLALWRHVRSLRLLIHLEDFGYDYRQRDGFRLYQASRYREMISTLTLLTRLESLQLDMTDQLETGPIESALVALSPHLRYFSLSLSSLPSSNEEQHPRPRFSFVDSLSELVSFSIQCPLPRLPTIDLSSMHQLEAFQFGDVEDLQKSGWMEQLYSFVQEKRLKSIVVRQPNGSVQEIQSTQWIVKGVPTAPTKSDAYATSSPYAYLFTPEYAASCRELNVACAITSQSELG